MCGPQIKINEDSYRFIKETCASFDNNPGELINVLHKTQEHFGYLPEEVQQVVADCLGIPVGKVYGVVSFYSFFTMKPKGKYAISVCLGTACYVKVPKRSWMLSRANWGSPKAASRKTASSRLTYFAA